MTFSYQLFGFNIASDIVCPELTPALAEVCPDVRFTLENLSEEIEQAGRSYPRSYLKLQFGLGVFQFEVPGIARYRIEGGDTIRVSPLANALEADVRPYLLGTGMGALLLQRRMLPLHVCAVAVNGHAYAFCGPSGAGKSTLALAFHRHGIPLLCDDVGLAVPQKDGSVLFYPGFPRVKLWRDTLGHFNIDETPLSRDVSRANKFHMEINNSFCARPLPLGGLYALERSEPNSAPRIEHQDRHQAIGMLIEHTYRTELIRDLGDARVHLQQCAAIAKSIPTFKFFRPWNLGATEQSLQFILEHFTRPQAMTALN